MLLIRRRAHGAGLAAPPGGVLGGLVVAGTATAALGPPIGGVLVDAWGWRTAFFVNLPFAGLALVMALVGFPGTRQSKARGRSGIAATVDVIGIVAFGGTMTALLVFLLGLPRPEWVASAPPCRSRRLVWWELRASRPFFDVRLLATHRALTRTYLRCALGALCVYTVLYGLTQWLEAGRALSPTGSGAASPADGRPLRVIAQPISPRNLVRVPLIAAAVACLAASAGVLVLTTSTPVIWIVVSPSLRRHSRRDGQRQPDDAVPPGRAAQIGTPSGLFKTFGSIGSIASSALISIAFHTRVDDPISTPSF